MTEKRAQMRPETIRQYNRILRINLRAINRKLARHPRFTFHFTPTSCSWANAVEGWFAKLTRHRLEHGVFRSIAELQAARNRYITNANGNPKPFVWTKSADAILAAVKRGRQTLESIH